MQKHGFPLAARILAIVALSILPCIGIVLRSASRLEASVLAGTRKTCLYVTASVTSQERLLLESVAQVMAGTAEAPPIRDLNPGESAEVLSPLERTNPYFAEMSLFAATGGLVAASDSAGDGRALDDGPFAGQGGFSLGTAVLRGGVPVLSARMPVLGRKGGIAGFLEARLDLATFLDTLAFSDIPTGPRSSRPHRASTATGGRISWSL
jgi:hypothetical protein